MASRGTHLRGASLSGTLIKASSFTPAGTSLRSLRLSIVTQTSLQPFLIAGRFDGHVVGSRGHRLGNLEHLRWRLFFLSLPARPKPSGRCRRIPLLSGLRFPWCTGRGESVPESSSSARLTGLALHLRVITFLSRRWAQAGLIDGGMTQFLSHLAGLLLDWLGRSGACD